MVACGQGISAGATKKALKSGLLGKSRTSGRAYVRFRGCVVPSSILTRYSGFMWHNSVISLAKQLSDSA